MDKATKRKRARSNAQRTPRGQLSPFEPRGLGRKGKPHETFPAKQCMFRHSFTTVPIKRYRARTGEAYTVMIEVGGHRCPNDALGSGYCVSHLGNRR